METALVFVLADTRPAEGPRRLERLSAGAGGRRAGADGTRALQVCGPATAEQGSAKPKDREEIDPLPFQMAALIQYCIVLLRIHQARMRNVTSTSQIYANYS